MQRKGFDGEFTMKVNLSIIAIVLSILALAVSLAQLYDSLPRTSALPSFNVSDFEIYETYTEMRVYNNGSTVVYDVRVLVDYVGSDPTSPLRERAFPLTVYVPQLAPGVFFEHILVPIGKMQLRTQTQDISEYVAEVWVSCDSFYPGLRFSFNVTE